MKALKDLEIFVRTAESNNLSATARAMHMTPAAASAAMKRLEIELGAELFVRSTRHLRLSQAGLFFLEQCRPAVATLLAAHQHLASGQHQLSGRLQLSAPSDLGRNVLLPMFDQFQELHPQIRIELQLSDRLANVFADPVDAAFRYGQPKDSSLVVLPVAPDNQRVLCAAPAYLEKFGYPQHPQEVAQHRCLCFTIGSVIHTRWQFFQDPNRTQISVNANPFNVSNDGDVVRRWALQGKGLTYKSRLDVVDDLTQGRLVALCKNWQTEAAPLFLTVPSRHQITPLLRALHEYVTQQLQSDSDHTMHATTQVLSPAV